MIDIVKLALEEDIGIGDFSSELLATKNVTAKTICKQTAIICGIDYFEKSFKYIDKKTKINWLIKEGEQVTKNSIICTIYGNNKSILKAERVALNFLQTLSSTATITNNLVKKVKTTKVKLLDTRKTIPNLRLAQKKAVICGGGFNHRFGLYDALMLKENHIASIGSIDKVVKIAQDKYPNLALIVEVEDIEQLKKVLKINNINRILCDNFSIKDLAIAVKLAKGIIELEASGGINENNIVAFANTGVDYISIGDITKNIKAIDLSIRFT
jgi:nicotinate-nucleotide pyrophosphorylase (carboxylating)